MDVSKASRCPDCNGTGRIVLLTSVRPCERCGGTGRLADEPSASFACFAMIANSGDPGDSLVIWPDGSCAQASAGATHQEA